MAVDTPVLERVTFDEEKKCAVPSRMDFMAEEEHNARIRDTYARLINPESKIEDVFNRTEEKSSEITAQPVMQSAPAQTVGRSVEENHPYIVENARADAAIFRADSAINARIGQVAEIQTAEVAVATPTEEENEDLRPTSTTIQYQTIGVASVKKESETEKKSFVFGKREKIIVAVFVAVVIALITLVIVNATIISNLNAEISTVQNSITTVSGAIKGVNSSVSDMVEEIVLGGLNN
ncbi:MAG: hypothetical protein K2J54_02690 [Clostridia bacterium]|nr:hypothetical protein [Clostridia bacterium]